MKTRCMIAAFVVMTGLFFTGCVIEPPACDANLKRLTYAHDSLDNVFRQVIPEKPALAANSAAIISRQLTRTESNPNLLITKGGYAHPVYYTGAAQSKTKYVKIVGLDGGIRSNGPTSCGPMRWRSCIAEGAAGDGHCVVVDEVDNCLTSFWMMNNFLFVDGLHTVSASAFPLWDVSGVAEPGEGRGAMAGNVSPYACMVWPDEATSGFNHGFMLSVDARVNNMDHLSLPLYAGDGDGTSSNDLTAGMQVQLNPTFNTDDLVFVQGGKTYNFKQKVGEALKTYGAYDGNSNLGNWSIKGVPRLGYDNDPWVGVLPDPLDDSVNTGIPISQFRVLAPKWNVERNYDVNNSCIEYQGVTNPLPPAPVISGISPSSGPISGGTVVTLTGTHFAGATKVRFNMSEATNLNVVSDNQVICTTPPQTGTAVVTLLNNAGSNHVEFTYTGGGGPAPVINSVSPTSGTNAGGTTVTINGSNLNYVMHVMFGGVPATDAVSVSSSQIVCTSPSVPSQTVSVQVRTPNGYSNYKDYTFTGASRTPTLTSVTPAFGSTSGGTAITLTGTNLAGAVTVNFNQNGTDRVIRKALNVVIDSDTQIRCTTPAFSGATTLTVATTTHPISNGVLYTFGDSPATPTLSSISPTSGPTAGGTACTLYGSNLAGCSAVSFGGLAATNIVAYGSAEVRCTSPAKSAGMISVTATTAEGTTNGVDYTYFVPPGPTLSSISPTAGTTAGGTACTLLGENLAGCSSVSFGGTAATGIVVDSSTQVRCTSPAKDEGAISVTATTANGTSNGVSFTYNDSQTYTATLYTPADARVRSNSPYSTSGTTTLMYTIHNGSTKNASFIKWDLSGIEGTSIIGAVMHLYVYGTTNSENVTNQVLSCSDDSWVETSINWNNMPQWGTVQTSFSAVPSSWIQVDVTDYVSANFNGDKLVTMILVETESLNRQVAYYTDESSNYRPMLVVTSQ